ncbi:tetratricopeptide repeat protein, partial [Actinospica sp.]|uniref:tetratricopeptide repeat protein n=1 Tax=Actinospica sp. TaxID=1872142 RepID=UPI002C633321
MHNDACRTPSDGQGEPRVEAEGELAVARLNLDGGDPEHAAVHVAQALHHDPTCEQCYTMIDELAGYAAGLEELASWFSIGEPMYLGGAVALAVLRARAGQYAMAIETLGQITAIRPDLPWCAAPWFGPHVAERVTGREAAVAVSHFASGLPDPAPAELAEVQAPWLEFARAVAAQPETTAQALAILSTLARRIGGLGEAIAWCTRSEMMDRDGAGEGESQVGALMLGFAYRSAGRPHEAIDAWERALELDPTNIDLYIDMAETCMQQDDHPQAITWAERAMQYDPEHVKPRGVRLAALYTQSDYTDGPALAALQRLAQENPEHPYPRHLLNLARQNRPWIGSVPWPTEATSGLLAQMLDGRMPSDAPFDSDPRLSTTSLEAPSPNALVRAYFPGLAIDAGSIPEPDIRIPVSTAFGTPLWTYPGGDVTEASTVTPPSAGAVTILRAVAGPGSWSDPISAFDGAAELGKLGERDLLGLVAHIPTPDDESWVQRWHAGPAYWARMAQAWACLGILHFRAEEPWRSSRRRTLLLRLLFGNEDWSVDAAAFALYVSALLHEDQRPDIAAAIGARYLHATLAFAVRPTELQEPMAHIVLACPGMHPRLVKYAHEMLALKRAADRDQPSTPKSLSDADALDWANQLLSSCL